MTTNFCGHINYNHMMSQKVFSSVPVLVVSIFVVFGLGVSFGVYLYPLDAKKNNNILSPVPVSTSNTSSVTMTSSTSRPYQSATSTPPLLPSPLGPNEIHWSDAITLINQCKVGGLLHGVYHSGIVDEIYLKSGQSKQIVESPGFEVMRSAAQAASSTCGVIRVGVAIE